MRVCGHGRMLRLGLGLLPSEHFLCIISGVPGDPVDAKAWGISCVRLHYSQQSFWLLRSRPPRPTLPARSQIRRLRLSKTTPSSCRLPSIRMRRARSPLHRPRRRLPRRAARRKRRLDLALFDLPFFPSAHRAGGCDLQNRRSMLRHSGAGFVFAESAPEPSGTEAVADGFPQGSEPGNGSFDNLTEWNR